MNYKGLFIIFLLLFQSYTLFSQTFIDFDIDTLSVKKACDSISLRFTNTSAGTVSSLQWDFGDGTTSNISPANNSYTAGKYIVTLTINGNPNLYKRDTIVVNTSPVALFTDSIIPNTGLFSRVFVDKSIKDTVNNPVYNYTLDYGDNTSLSDVSINVLKKYTSAGNKTVQMIISDPLGCADTSEITINITDIPNQVFTNLPNVFTPNNDGINDLFIINANGITNLSLEIFNRSGEIIYKSDAKTITWDGKTSSGSDAPTGTYYYILSSENDHYEIVKNKIYLFREEN